METLSKFLSTLDIATTILLLLLCLGVWVLWNVQKNPSNEFDFEEMLRDESGKPSAFRLTIFVSLAVSTWIIMFIVLNTNALDTWMFVTYLGIWSGAKVAETAIIAYAARGGSGVYDSSEDSRDNKYSDYSDRRPRYERPSRRRYNNKPEDNYNHEE